MTSPKGAPIEAFDELDSTNAEARRRAQAGEAGPLWITARRQSAGRGRLGRKWETGEGNLAATLLMTTSHPAARAAQISFAAVLAAADLADNYLPSELVTLKWPNDMLIGGRKVSGILVESGSSEHGGLWVAIGIGVNLDTAPSSSAIAATTFRDHMRQPPPPPLEALSVLAKSADHWLNLWDQVGMAALAPAWTARAHGLGSPCVVRLPRETLEGVAEGLDVDGALRLRMSDGGFRRITAGDVFFQEG